MRTLADFKNAAAAAGIDWGAARALYDSMRADEMSAHERTLDFRRTAFSRLTGHASGGRAKTNWRRELSGGDYDTIPGFDVAAADLSIEYPDILPADNPAAELWAILSAPAPSAPPAADTMRRALDRAVDDCPAAPGSLRDFVSTDEAAAAAGVSPVWMRRLVKAGKIPGRRVGKSYLVSLSAAAQVQRHPTAGRPRHTLPDVPF
jgi:excisionase family DNA binding protein